MMDTDSNARAVSRELYLISTLACAGKHVILSPVGMRVYLLPDLNAGGNTCSFTTASSLSGLG